MDGWKMIVSFWYGFLAGAVFKQEKTRCTENRLGKFRAMGCFENVFTCGRLLIAFYTPSIKVLYKQIFVGAAFSVARLTQIFPT